ncbi:uncharacterized protein N7484_010900 [Penicillium longicatenatum]|uniref:uncharacterized protein n=1 Tax=Penicillium longicatenatum TaxID=1561947 RepID=UPI002548B65B|nr:uncharacterized protein N7484_010900 [Penicillium longicatenatum]KAJ5630800.1 hypothetical protein N7484_010900 [Penicillium longicatenatum]
MPSKPTILLLGTCDSKLPELLYTKSQLESQKSHVLLMDIGHKPTSHPEIDITQHDILNPELTRKSSLDPPRNTDPPEDIDIGSLSREAYIKTLTPLAIRMVTTLMPSLNGILGIGGSCGTTLAAAVMRDAVPVGFPKLMVSTMASGDVGPYIGETDIAMMYSVVDIAGRNRVLDRVLGNAAAAIVGMGWGYLNRRKTTDGGKVRIGITMFGVTTPAATMAKEHLELLFPGSCEIYIFHATGSGGRAMERLVAEGQLDAILDLTTTEIADEVVGGVLGAGPGRLRAATARNIPRVVSVGACDMVNFGMFESVPPCFKGGDSGVGRVLHRHNPTITLMRTTKEECESIARLISKNLLGDEGGHHGSTSRTKVIFPTGGISMLDRPDQPFWDPEADDILFSTLENELKGSGIEVVRDKRDINNPEFAIRVAEMLHGLIEESSMLGL